MVIENIRNPAKFMICSKFAPNLMCLRHSDHHTSKGCQQHVQPSIFTGQITVHCDSIKSFGEDSVLKWPKPFVLFRAFGDNALIFEAYFWISSQKQEVDTKNMNPKFLILYFRNFNFLIHNANNSETL